MLILNRKDEMNINIASGFRFDYNNRYKKQMKGLKNIMKKDRVLNPKILEAIATTGHTDMLVIGDCGLPLPKGVEVIDVSVTAGLPKFLDLLTAVNTEFVSESAIVASEIADRNPEVWQRIQAEMNGAPIRLIPHEEFKKLTASARYIIRTGETSPYANIILIGGVNF